MPALSTVTLQILVFVTLVLVFALAWLVHVPLVAHRRRRSRIRARARAQAQSTRSRTETSELPPASICDLEKGSAVLDNSAAAPSSRRTIPLFSALKAAFLGWRHRVLYTSDSLPELAVLPWYKHEESLSRKILNFVLRKERVKPEPPTVASVRRAVEAHEGASSHSYSNSGPPTLPAIPPVPEIVLHCVCNKARFALVDPDDSPSCSCLLSRSSSQDLSLARPSSPPSSFEDPELDLAHCPTVTASESQDITTDNSSIYHSLEDESTRGFSPPSSSFSSQDPHGGQHESDRMDADASRGQPKALTNGPTHSGAQQTKTFIVVTPTSVSARKPDTSSCSTHEPATTSQPSSSLPAAAQLSLPVLRLSPTFSTTTSLVDLLLEAISADTDVSDAASSTSTSISSLCSASAGRRSSCSSDNNMDDPVSEVLSLYFSDAEDDYRASHAGSDSATYSGSSDDGASVSSRSSMSSSTMSTDSHLQAEVSTGWRASLTRIWAAHGVTATVLSA